MGKVIKFLLGKYPGRIDGKVLSELVLKRLSQVVTKPFMIDKHFKIRLYKAN